MRVKLLGKGNVNLYRRLNTERLFHNEITFELYIEKTCMIADLIVIYKYSSSTNIDSSEYYNSFNFASLPVIIIWASQCYLRWFLNSPSVTKCWFNLCVTVQNGSKSQWNIESCLKFLAFLTIAWWLTIALKYMSGNINPWRPTQVKFISGYNLYNAPSVIPATYTQTTGAYNNYYNKPNSKIANNWCLVNDQ